MLNKVKRKVIAALTLVLICLGLYGQEEKGIVNYLDPGDYVLDGITISGVRYLDTNALIGLSGLRIGEEISVPGDKITTAVMKLWDQGLFSDIRVTISKIEGDNSPKRRNEAARQCLANGYQLREKGA